MSWATSSLTLGNSACRGRDQGGQDPPPSRLGRALLRRASLWPNRSFGPLDNPGELAARCKVGG